MSNIINYNTSLKARDAGFIWLCDDFYRINRITKEAELITIYDQYKDKYNEFDYQGDEIPAPLLDDLRLWFSTKYNIDFVIDVFYNKLGDKYFTATIVNSTERINVKLSNYSELFNNYYEHSYYDAIDKCFEEAFKLIKK